MHTVTANGSIIPALGFGTFRMSGADVLRIVPHALKLGFRHVDTAQIYGNEAEVGDAIAASGVPRSDIFLTTKVWVENYAHEAFLTSVEQSLRKLKTDYVDLLLLHWPSDIVSLAEQVEALNEVKDAGKVRHIGVSNFNTTLMTEAVSLSNAPLVTNQIEYHPYLDQTVVIETAMSAGMSVTGYYGMADGKVFTDPILQDIAASHRKSVAQVVLRWLVQQQGIVALSKTIAEARVAENIAIFDFALSADEMATIHGLSNPNGRIVSPHGLAPVWDNATR
ncbi:2,5-didehydrogluconate reductase [Rhizobium sp. TH135]|uniref:aldo/keto reductase n=1 Tax=Rhizobium sp. TH135 TaxID=2067451 RepID=UPI000C7D2746|nr:aldo/keto reductase [Rhizobium sp. TH135]PLK68838.1 2,5-didehydrogluconate reductase [Rhizobium sp. TH135]